VSIGKCEQSNSFPENIYKLWTESQQSYMGHSSLLSGYFKGSQRDSLGLLALGEGHPTTSNNALKGGWIQ